MPSDTTAVLQPGPELDAMVAVGVMEWKLETQRGSIHGARDERGRFRLWAPEHMSSFDNFWSPSTDIAAAMEVVAKLSTKLEFYLIRNGDGMPPFQQGLWRCGIEGGGFAEDCATPELAICLAALAARRAMNTNAH